MPLLLLQPLLRLPLLLLLLLWLPLRPLLLLQLLPLTLLHLGFRLSVHAATFKYFLTVCRWLVATTHTRAAV